MLLRRLAESGRSIIFISHKLYEVLEIADRITVIRRGKVVGERLPKDNEEDLAELMVGREVKLDRRSRRVASGRRQLKLEDMKVNDDRGHEAVSGVSLEIRSGEILGIAGVAGNGQDELVEALIGLRAEKSRQGQPRRTRHDQGVAARHQPSRRGLRAGRSPSFRPGALLLDSRQPRPDQLLPPSICTRPVARDRARSPWTPKRPSRPSISGRRRRHQRRDLVRRQPAESRRGA